MRRKTVLSLEHLEDRLTPATFGNPWPDPHLTISFAPDKTQVANRQNVLMQTFNTLAPTSTWELAVLKAFQTWAASSNLNFSVMSDGGQPLGTHGPYQGDSRFGDVRVAASPFLPQDAGDEDLAVASPFQTTAGTWSGDVNINSSQPFSLGGKSGTYDLYSVLLHEAGHALGLDHSLDSASVMYEDYTGVRTGLSSGDVEAIQALYGARQRDSFEGTSGNDSFSTASYLQVPLGSSDNVTLQADANVTTLQDKDYYRFNTLLSTLGLQVSLQTTGISLLNARVTVYDSAKNVVASTVDTNPMNGDININLSSVKPLSTYYVKVESGTADVFGVGKYRLKVTYIPSLSLPLTSLTGMVTGTVTTLLNVDLHTNDSFLTAGLLPSLTPQTDARFDFVYKASISDSSDVDIYKIASPTPPAGSTNTMTALIWGLDSLSSGGLDPRVTVYDAWTKPVAADVLVNDNGTYTLQVANAAANATYYVKVAAANPGGSNNVGNYFLGVDFGTKPVVLNSYVGSTLSQSNLLDASKLSISQSQLFHFVLSADLGGSTVQAAVRMTVFDTNNNAVLSFVAGAGTTVTRDLFLGSGTYTIRFAGGTATGVPLPALTYRLGGLSLTDPIGMGPEDSTAAPASSSTSPSSSSSNPYYWSSGPEPSYSPSDPYSNPYSTA